MKTHIEGAMYGDSYGGHNLWRTTERVQCMETHIEGTLYRVSFRGYIVWRFI